jgi:acyl-CoA synthetase (AMP-forming)/AMP-acid ligase II
MLVCENCRAFAAFLLALASLDAWPVLVNARLAPPEVDQILEHCGARRVIYTVGVSVPARKHAARHGATIQEDTGWGPIGIGPLRKQTQPEPLSADVPDRIAALIYTSGTTGLPKGVMLSHRNLLFMAAVSGRIRSLTPEDGLLGILPMSHAVGLAVVLLGTLITGGTVFLSARFDAGALLESLEKQPITILLGTPSLFALLLEYAEWKGMRSLRFPNLRVISSSGAPLPPAVKAGVETLFGLVLHNGYGVTECSPTIALTRLESPRTDTSVGQIFPGLQIKLVDPQGREVATGEVGELWVRGPNVMKGYYRAPQDTADALNSEGWFNTRDLARLQDDHLFIVGRTKDLIVRSGFNVYPAEVEAVLNSHPAVARSAVIGREIAGEEQVIAFVQLRQHSAVDAQELANHAAQNLAPYKLPSRILILPKLPLTPTGKVKKEHLSQMLAGDLIARS